MPKSNIPLLHMWELYPEDMKELLINPLGAATKALEKANENADWEDVHKATELLNFLSNEVN